MRNDLEEIARRLEGSVARLGEVRRRVLEDAGGQALSAVQAKIGGSGKVQDWQSVYLGSRGGYAAVRPKAGTYTGTGRRLYPVGYVTNAIENGHRVRPASGTAKRSRPSRAAVSFVPGKHMYLTTTTGQIAAAAAEQIEREMGRVLGGM